MFLGKLRYLCYLIVGYIAPELFGSVMDITINWWIPIVSTVATVVVLLAVEHLIFGTKYPFLTKTVNTRA